MFVSLMKSASAYVLQRRNTHGAVLAMALSLPLTTRVLVPLLTKAKNANTKVSLKLDIRVNDLYRSLIMYSRGVSA